MVVLKIHLGQGSQVRDGLSKDLTVVNDIDFEFYPKTLKFSDLNY